MKTRAEKNESDNRKTVQKNTSWFFEKTNRINTLLDKLKKGKKKKDTND